MLKILPILFLATLPHRVFAQEDCNPSPDLAVNVTPVFEEPSYNFTSDISGILDMLGDTQHSIQESHDALPLGVTRYEPIVEFHMPVTSVTFPDGLSCTRVERADVTIGYRNVVVSIAQEIPEGSCGFDEIMAHEQKHIAVNRQILQEYAPQIGDRLRGYLAANSVFREENPDYAVSLLQKNLKDMLDDFAREMTDDNRDRQHEVDSPEEYRRLSASCNGQLAKAAEHFWNDRR